LLIATKLLISLIPGAAICDEEKGKEKLRRHVAFCKLSAELTEKSLSSSLPANIISAVKA
jgi:hypothetical protein